jgi:hypothetical protein
MVLRIVEVNKKLQSKITSGYDRVLDTRSLRRTGPKPPENAIFLKPTTSMALPITNCFDTINGEHLPTVFTFSPMIPKYLILMSMTCVEIAGEDVASFY